MHPITAAELSQRRMLACERHERHLHDPVFRQRVHGQAYAVHRDGPMEDRRFFDFGRHANIHEHRVLHFGDPCDGTHAIDVALHEMPAQPVARAQGAFKIDGPALLPFTNQGAIERRRNGVDRETALLNPLDRQACPVDGDTLALLHAFVRRLYTQLHAVVQRHRVQSSNRIYDSGKHSRRSKTNNVSEPKGPRSTTTHRGASASGNARTPRKAGTALSPSQTGDCTPYKRSTGPSARSVAPSAPPPSHNNDWIPARRSWAKACDNASGRKTRTPLLSSTDTFAIGASGDATTQVGTSRAVCTSDTPRLSMARRSNTMRTGGLRGVSPPRAVSCGLSVNAVVPPTAIASNPARSQWTWSRASGPEIHCERPPASAIRPSMDVASLSATNGRSAWCRVKGTAEFGVPPFRDGLVATQDHRADQGVRGHTAPAAPRELERAAHGRQLTPVISLQTAPQACCPRAPLR